MTLMHELFTDIPLSFAAALFLFALLVGSFLNVVIHRLPIMMEREWRDQCAELAASPASELPEGRFDLVAPRSRCPSCGTQITALQNIPVLSYLWLRGKCAHCGVQIPVRYPAIELLTAIATALAGWRFGFGWEAAAAVLMTWALIATSFIDIDHQIIPDSISLPLVWIGLGLSLFHPIDGAETLFIDPRTSIVGALAGYLSLWSVYHVFRLVTGKEGMGYGDFKLLAALGAWLGWQLLPMIILLSAVVGAVIGISMIVIRRHDRNVPIPFGPYLAAAGWVAMLYGSEIMDLYLGYLH
ncbi:MAG: A24 family peptidase [Gammaproteobacteria bacterium]|nr:A24 family peptidase [Gammaproteobacteria bacterium]MDH4253806.1 A24 family peptidase [Gammaproteobacteria bacterium]MDH5308621.1 A24 family peptidase [Gammaproteobacteria bacterium]